MGETPPHTATHKISMRSCARATFGLKFQIFVTRHFISAPSHLYPPPPPYPSTVPRQAFSHHFHTAWSILDMFCYPSIPRRVWDPNPITHAHTSKTTLGGHMGPIAAPLPHSNTNPTKISKILFLHLVARALTRPSSSFKFVLTLTFATTIQQEG